MLEAYVNTRFALEPAYHDRMAAVVLRRLNAGKKPFAATAGRKPPYGVQASEPLQGKTKSSGKKKAAVSGYDYMVSKVSTKSGMVAVIPIMGVMSRYGDFCSWGSEDIANWVMEAGNDPNVSAIVLEINSPGGSVDGTEMLGEVVKSSQKPVVAWVAGMAASAAYWVASQAREIYMESETSSEVGSIGVLAMHVDASGWLEREGYKVTILRSDGSPDKALFNSYEPLSETVVNDAKASLNLLRDAFVKTVKAGRPGIAGDVFSGKMYAGKEAIGKKMADKIGALGDAIKRADLLARKDAGLV